MAQPLTGTLYVVATPIGNLEDLSYRAARILGEVDRVLCEDTRLTRKLLNHIGVLKPTSSFHEHNEKERAPGILKELQAGKNLALVSDAGTPLISDPGFGLVHLCREAGVPVVPVPGPCAATAALSVSGISASRFLFLGFLPKKAGPLRRELERFGRLEATLIVYLSPHNLAATLDQILDVLGNRSGFLIREMTKVHETAHFEPLKELTKRVAKEPPRGEYVLVLEAGTEEKSSPAGIDLRSYVEGLMQVRGLSRPEAARLAADHLGLSRREIYTRARS